jgi:hypothetical protein
MERSINGMIDSMTQRITVDVVSPIREAVMEYYRETPEITIVDQPVASPMAEMITASVEPKAVEMTFTAEVNPELLSR